MDNLKSVRTQTPTYTDTHTHTSTAHINQKTMQFSHHTASAHHPISKRKDNSMIFGAIMVFAGGRLLLLFAQQQIQDQLPLKVTFVFS